MAKNLVVCCDGTWNDPDELRDHVAKPTNVAKLALALVSDVDKSAGERSQLMHYEPGVGTTADERLIGGAFGYGLSRNIRDGYRFLAQNYAPGDRIFLFGFSRGAYTARSLAGLIHNCGVLRADCIDQVDAAFAFYRDRTNQTHPRTPTRRCSSSGCGTRSARSASPRAFPAGSNCRRSSPGGSSCGGSTTRGSAPK
jgi:uncharacterized protein (DUF2235 family)